jgi:hypothetical protein
MSLEICHISESAKERLADLDAGSDWIENVGERCGEQGIG